MSPQNALIRELDHTKKLIEESHHEKVSHGQAARPVFVSLVLTLLSSSSMCVQEQLLIQIETMRAESEQGRSRSNSLLHG